jgi:Cof subfamily protein (haloacid dehalogenase superfamily)
MGILPRLVATDLDGTLVRRDRSLSPRTAAALDRIPAEVVLVTGRPVRWLHQVYDQLRAPLPAVCANGAVVYDPGADRVLRANPLDPELLAEVARRLRAEVPDAVFAVEVEDGRKLRHDADWPVLWDADDPTIRAVTSPEDLVSAPAVKLLIRAGERDPDVFVKVVAAALGGLAEATHSSYSGLVEISAAGVTKAAGLAWFCEQRGIASADVVAFGDMPNDVPMLTWAGRAVAVANAHPAVRDIADDVTLSNEDDGVAAYLEKLFELS